MKMYSDRAGSIYHVCVNSSKIMDVNETLTLDEVVATSQIKVHQFAGHKYVNDNSLEIAQENGYNIVDQSGTIYYALPEEVTVNGIVDGTISAIAFDADGNVISSSLYEPK